MVDATNYILHETGQPLHAFDVAKIRGGRVVVRAAHEGETLITLDGKERRLKRENLVIADAERALVVAGVMGSVQAEVDDATRDIFLEVAWFNPVSIRRTSKQLGLSTDSSYRFERGVDPTGAEYAALRCLDLIIGLAGGELLGPPLVAGEPPLVERGIDLSPAWVRERLGFEVSDAEIEDILRRLELRPRETADATGGKLFRLTIPGFRADLGRPIDIVEEVIRHYGSDRIPEGPVRATVTLREDDPEPVYQRAATAVLAGKGFHEVVHYTLRSEDELRRWYGHAQADALAVANPLASDASHLRTSLLPGLLDCLRLNHARHNLVERLFECGRVFREYDGRVYEMFSAAFVVLASGRPSWRRRDNPDYYLAARLVCDLLGQAGVAVRPWEFRPITDENAWQAGHAAALGGFAEGWEAKAGLLNLAMTGSWDLPGPVLAGAVYLLPEFLARPRPRRLFQPFSQHPPALRDLAVIVPATMPAGELERIVRAEAERRAGDQFAVESLRVFDVYSGPGVPEGHKSVALELVFRHPQRTLSDKEVNPVFQQLLDDLDAMPGLRVRRG